MLLGQQPQLVRALSNSSSGITILAPSNAAFTKFLAVPENKAAAGKTDVVAAILEYHVLNGTFPASKFTKEAQFVPTLLTNPTYTQVTGGQVVQVVLDGSNAVVTTGLKEKSKTTQTVSHSPDSAHSLNALELRSNIISGYHVHWWRNAHY